MTGFFAGLFYFPAAFIVLPQVMSALRLSIPVDGAKLYGFT